MTADLRCSSWTRDNGVDPIGSAGSYAGFLLVEWPLPWPRDVSEMAELGPVADAARRAGVRLQALVPEPARGPARVVYYEWDPATGSFAGREAPAGGDPAAVARELLAGHPVPGQAAVAGADLLVCGHGRRDRCCGSMGTALEAELTGSGTLPPEVRVWRTSHTGGHRFAPTAVLLPSGTCWGYLDAPTLAAVVGRDGPVGALLPHYRGCAGLASAAVQAVERSVMEQVGWSLLDRPRWGEEAADGSVRLVVEDADGSRRSWQARVSVSRVLPVPQCGEPVTGREKTEEELAVEDLHELTAAP